ncbi:MAG TPA: SpoVR family protein [Syntrophorhabdaceae bacterium]|jgi:stage V sporulation protein R
MELVSQHTKKIMEGCKERAKDAGLTFQTETLEYIVSNKDLLELGPKNMIPTLYDYWVHDVEVLREKGKYELFPHNPYETVINTRPAISFYNDNNPDWLNVMIFYHVLAHIDFFQNNLYYRHTWDEDFAGQALSDKRTVAMLRSEKGRWVDYVIEFARGIDNLVNYYGVLSDFDRASESKESRRLDYYYDIFLQKVKGVTMTEYLKELERYNEAVSQYGAMGASVFFSAVVRKYPEFEAMFERQNKKGKSVPPDILQFLETHSPFLQKEENRWMITIMEIVRKTSLYFQPQIRTKIMNEGWASYWHDQLFMKDTRIKGNEVNYASVNAKVTALPRMGLNPYALGMRLFSFIEEMAGKGRLGYDFQRITRSNERNDFDKKSDTARDCVFKVRSNLNDFVFINTFIDQDFVDRYKLFVTGRRPNAEKNAWEYYVKSRKADDYKQMLLDSLYHPPHIKVNEEKSKEGSLYLDHRFEEKPLVQEFIANTMMGIEYLWGGPVKLETTEFVAESDLRRTEKYYYGMGRKLAQGSKKKVARRTVYTMEKQKLTKILMQ